MPSLQANALAAVQDVAKAAREMQQACKLCCCEGDCWQQITEAAQLLSIGWQAQVLFLLFYLTVPCSAVVLFSSAAACRCIYLDHDLLQHWAYLIAKAEAPNPLSSRDGKLLRRVPVEGRLDLAQTARNLEAVLPFRLKQESIQLLLQAWSTGELRSLHTCSTCPMNAGAKACKLHTWHSCAMSCRKTAR